MTRETPIQELLFDVDQVPIEAITVSDGQTRRIAIPGKKALLNRSTGHVLGVVSKDYRVVTNQEAIGYAHQVCDRAFPGVTAVEWQAMRAAAPLTLSYAFIDLMHRTHVMNYYDTEIKKEDPFTPFLRVTNSFNGARALRFDIGFMRKHCANGVIFEEEVVTIKAAHSTEALEKLKFEITSRSLPTMWDEFSNYLGRVRKIAMTPGQSILALNAVLRPPQGKPEDSLARREGLKALSKDFSARLTSYQNELGPNAYAVFNTFTDIAARPPANRFFQKDRHTIEKRAGRWFKELANVSQQPTFDLNRWIPAWEPPDKSRQIPGRN